uniref:Uncharacterized protein n=1 Tax=Kuenenia stuttgartiensis TaxID=174633 RepID=Q1Q6C3_KUEST|nr:unknown protein [Candidatus Kuenenia stuttgartiensis]
MYQGLSVNIIFRLFDSFGVSFNKSYTICPVFFLQRFALWTIFSRIYVFHRHHPLYKYICRLFSLTKFQGILLQDKIVSRLIFLYKIKI